MKPDRNYARTAKSTATTTTRRRGTKLETTSVRIGTNVVNAGMTTMESDMAVAEAGIVMVKDEEGEEAEEDMVTTEVAIVVEGMIEVRLCLTPMPQKPGSICEKSRFE